MIRHGWIIRRFRRRNVYARGENMEIPRLIYTNGFPKTMLRPVSIAMFNLCNDRWGILWKRRGNHRACERGTLPQYDSVEAKNLGYQYPREEA